MTPWSSARLLHEHDNLFVPLGPLFSLFFTVNLSVFPWIQLGSDFLFLLGFSCMWLRFFSWSSCCICSNTLLKSKFLARLFAAAAMAAIWAALCTCRRKHSYFKLNICIAMSRLSWQIMPLVRHCQDVEKVLHMWTSARGLSTLTAPHLSYTLARAWCPECPTVKIRPGQIA